MGSWEAAGEKDWGRFQVPAQLNTTSCSIFSLLTPPCDPWFPRSLPQAALKVVSGLEPGEPQPQKVTKTLCMGLAWKNKPASTHVEPFPGLK